VVWDSVAGIRSLGTWFGISRRASSLIPLRIFQRRSHGIVQLVYPSLANASIPAPFAASTTRQGRKAGSGSKPPDGSTSPCPSTHHSLRINTPLINTPLLSLWPGFVKAHCMDMTCGCEFVAPSMRQRMLVLVLVIATVLQAHESSPHVDAGWEEDLAMRETINDPLIGRGMERPRTPVLIAV
jgi:hypothetical protein